MLKFILGRSIRFHDLAFFDPVIYESLRQLVVDAESKEGPAMFSALDLTFRFVSKKKYLYLLLFVALTIYKKKKYINFFFFFFFLCWKI